MVFNSGYVIKMEKKSLQIKLKLYNFPFSDQAQDTQSLMAWVNALRESNPEKDVCTVFISTFPFVSIHKRQNIGFIIVILFLSAFHLFVIWKVNLPVYLRFI